jgi:hypothetical protein
MVTPIEIGPAHRIRFPESSDIVSAVFSQDGSSLFVHIKPTTINIWHVIVDRWEIVLGVVVGLLLLACGSFGSSCAGVGRAASIAPDATTVWTGSGGSARPTRAPSAVAIWGRGVSFEGGRRDGA